MHNHEGWHRALDLQMDLHKWCRSDYGARYLYAHFWDTLGPDSIEDITLGYDDRETSAAELAAHVAVTLWRGDTIYVTSDMLHLLLQAAHDLPAEAEFDSHVLITRFGFCLFEEPLEGVDRSGRAVRLHAISWENAPVRSPKYDPERQEIGEAIIVYFWVDPYDDADVFNPEFRAELQKRSISVPPLALLHWYPAKIGDRIPEVSVMGSEIVVGTLKLFVAMNLLAQQSIGEPMKLRPKREARRRLQREYPKQPERMITLITLRRKSVKHDEPQEQIPWTRRWVVRGHWRRQWYPKTKRHDWKYIHEYIKGPEDKPLIIAERRVFNFRR